MDTKIRKEKKRGRERERGGMCGKGASPLLSPSVVVVVVVVVVVTPSLYRHHISIDSAHIRFGKTYYICGEWSIRIRLSCAFDDDMSKCARPSPPPLPAVLSEKGEKGK